MRVMTMVTNVIRVGDKIDLVSTNVSEGEEDRKVYKSQVYDVAGEEQLKITMPQEKGRLLLLHLDTVYRLQFYAETGLYECKGKVVDRYKTDNVYVVVVDIISALKKIQRREFYRLNCLLETGVHILKEEELIAGDLHHILKMQELSRPVYEEGIIVDISGGGARIVADCEVEEGIYVILKFQTEMRTGSQEYELLARVVTRRSLENRKKKYELRVEFEQISNKVRESLIKYIFEEERKNRKNEKG
ncbi:MAG: flagellar brake protein [Lachnospiraceae bacterium]|nr:flagellar brake protein [Lachnospiraceae bacterium]